jgi:hypothetical protein
VRENVDRHDLLEVARKDDSGDPDIGSDFNATIAAEFNLLQERIERLYSGDVYQTGMMQAILIGQSFQLQKVWTEQYRSTGTFHALVISGTHAAVLAAFQEEGVEAALFAGKFWMQDLLRADRTQADAVAASFETQAQSRSDAHLSRVVLSTFGALGISILDQRDFMGDWLVGSGGLTGRVPAEDEWRDVHTGMRVARALADHGVGQTVVLRHGVVTAVEAVEGTTAAIERGMALAGRGAVIVKTVAGDHDYRFDLPAVGPETIDAAARGGAGVLAIQAGRVVVLGREQALARATAAGLAVVGVDDEWPTRS